MPNSITDQLFNATQQIKPFPPTASLSDILITKILVPLIDIAYYFFLIAILITGAMYLFSSVDEEKLVAVKKNFLYAVIGFVVVAFAYTAVELTVRATGHLPGMADPVAGFRIITAGIFRWVSMIAGAGFMVLLLLGGFRYLTSAGIEETAHKAKQQMLHATIGLVLTLSAFAIGSFIINQVMKIRGQ